MYNTWRYNRYNPRQHPSSVLYTGWMPRTSIHIQHRSSIQYKGYSLTLQPYRHWILLMVPLLYRFVFSQWSISVRGGYQHPHPTQIINTIQGIQPHTTAIQTLNPSDGTTTIQVCVLSMVNICKGGYQHPHPTQIINTIQGIQPHTTAIQTLNPSDGTTTIQVCVLCIMGGYQHPHPTQIINTIQGIQPHTTAIQTLNPSDGTTTIQVCVLSMVNICGGDTSIHIQHRSSIQYKGYSLTLQPYRHWILLMAPLLYRFVFCQWSISVRGDTSIHIQHRSSIQYKGYSLTLQPYRRWILLMVPLLYRFVFCVSRGGGRIPASTSNTDHQYNTRDTASHYSHTDVESFWWYHYYTGLCFVNGQYL